MECVLLIVTAKGVGYALMELVLSASKIATVLLEIAVTPIHSLANTVHVLG